MPVSGICCALGYWPSTCAPQPDCCANGRLPLALPRMSAAAIAVEALVGVVVTGVAVTVCTGATVGVGVTVALDAFCTLTLMTSLRVEPSEATAVAVSVWLPFENFVVSSTHCMPSDGALSVPIEVLSTEKRTLDTEPEALT